MDAKDLILIPEPKLSSFLLREYRLNTEETIEYYNTLFSGKSAEEIIRFFNGIDKNIIYDNNREITFRVSYAVFPFNYNAFVGLVFDDGVFHHAEMGAHGIK